MSTKRTETKLSILCGRARVCGYSVESLESPMEAKETKYTAPRCGNGVSTILMYEGKAKQPECNENARENEVYIL